MNTKFYICRHCGNLIGMIQNSGVPVYCCGEKMQQLVPASVEASTEKHLPVVAVDGNKVTVKVGSIAHPMTEEHHIEWVYLHTEKGGQRKNLAPNDEPTLTFCLSPDDKPIAAYAYCNLHGLWETTI